jgi:hypothetical protein
MNGCKYIRKLIDEAEKPDLLPFDVSEHMVQCTECERFANERSALRQLVAAGTRVSAPINFDAVLKARLAEVKSRSPFWWLGSPALLRLGAATTGAVAMLVLAQYTGWLSNNTPPANESIAKQAMPAPAAPAPSSGELVPLPVAPPTHPEPSGSVRQLQATRKPSTGRRAVPVDSAMPAGYLTGEDGGVVLLRGRNGDVDVQMPTVSVGAQPLLYVSAGQRTVRSVGTSF